MNGRVFISYRRRLLARVEPVAAALQRAEIDYFLDVKDIDPLEPFPERIRNAIDGSHALLAVWSADYGDSDHCLAELKRAWQHARRYGPDVGRRVWIVNPEGSADHITAGELAEQNFLALPEPGCEDAWVAVLKDRLATLVPEGPLADERKARPAPVRRNVPTPTATFTGRNAEMFRIHSRLHPARIGGAGAAVAVQTHGLGGVGKTELAAKYADDFADAYDEIVWLNLAGYQPGPAAKADEAEAAWLRAAEQCWRGEQALFLDAEGKAAAPALVRRRLAERFAGRGAYLWVLDNVPVLQPEDVRDRILAFWRAPTASGRTLITTRDSRPAAGIAAERLEVLGEEDALRLLHRYRPIGHDERAAAEGIVAEVGGHTQALVLLGERLREGAGGYLQALDRLRNEGRLDRIEAIAEQLRGELGEKARGIVATFADSIGAQDAPSQGLLRLAAECAANEPIPLALLAAASGVQTNDDGFDGALRRLLRASLLTRRREGDEPGAPVEVHPLVADVARRLVGPLANEPAGQLERALLDLLQEADDVLRRDDLAPLIVHARQFALGRETEQAISLALRIGHYERARGIYSLARKVEERAMAVSRRILGEEHPATLVAMSNLAGTLLTQGDLAAAQELHQKSLKMSRRVLGEESLDTLATQIGLAATLLAQGDFMGALVQAEDALAVGRRVHGEEAPFLLAPLNVLVLTFQSLGNLPLAQALAEKAVAMSRQVRGADHPETLTSMNNLALILGSQGNFAGARELQETVLRVRRRVLGEQHPATLTVWNNLGTTLRDYGDLAGAQEIFEKVFEMRCCTLGDEHLDTVTTMVNLASTLQERGNLAGARALHEKALEADRRLRGEEHPNTLSSAARLLENLIILRDYAGARSLLRKTALRHLPEISDEQLNEELRGVKSVIVNMRKQFGLRKGRWSRGRR